MAICNSITMLMYFKSHLCIGFQTAYFYNTHLLITSFIRKNNAY